MHGEFTVRSEQQTAAFADQMRSAIEPFVRKQGVLIGLGGELGSGKTTFSKFLAQAFGAKVPASSPTFVLGHEYPCAGGVVIEHWDLYRVRGASPQEIFEGRAPGKLQLVEWIVNDPDLLSSADCTINFAIRTESERQVTVEIALGSAILQAFSGVVSWAVQGFDDESHSKEIRRNLSRRH